jgi:hypothetical protein
MKIRNKALFLLIVFFSMQKVYGYTGKLYINPRPHGVNLAMEYSGGYQELLNRIDKDKFGGNLSVASFYQEEMSRASLGKYFGIKNKNVISLCSKKLSETKDVEIDYIIRNLNDHYGNLEASITLLPSYRVHGFYFNYHQEFDLFFSGFYFNISVPVVDVFANMRHNFNVTSDDKTKLDEIKNSKMEQFFDGDYGVQVSNNDIRQERLRNALLSSDQASGIADVDINLGYTLFDDDAFHCSCSTGVTIPTGNDSNGRKLFQAIVGNDQHFGFGVGIDGTVDLWKSDESGIVLNSALKYRYLLKGERQRTFGIKGELFGHYMLVVDRKVDKKGGKIVDENNTKLEDCKLPLPAANVTNCDINVTPGSQVEGIMNFLYYNDWFHIDLGYNFFYSSKESLSVKSKFDNKRYSLVAHDYKSSSSAINLNEVTNYKYGSASKYINLDVDSVRMPAKFINKIYVDIACVCKKWDNPMLFSLGGHVEFCSSANAFNTWMINGKVGLSF